MSEQAGPSSVGNSERNHLGRRPRGFALRSGGGLAHPAWMPTPSPIVQPRAGGGRDMCPKCVTECRNEGQMGEWVEDGAS